MMSKWRLRMAGITAVVIASLSGSANAQAFDETIPIDAFGESSSGPSSASAPTTFSAAHTAPTGGGSTALVSSSAPASSSPPKEAFSLGDFAGQFFDLRPPGDPNHPDKLRLTLGTNVGYDSNVFTTYADPIASATTSLNGTAAYNFGSDRLKINSSLALGTTYYDNRPGDNTDFNGAFNAAVAYSVTRRLQISLSGGAFYASQPNPTLIGGTTRFSGDYSGANLNISASYSLRPRLSMRVEFHESTIQYAEEDQNQALGFSDQTYVIGLDYLISPRVTLTTEYRYNPLSYEAEGQDSTGQIFTVGFITSISPRLQWTLQAGAEGRTSSASDQTGEATYIGPFMESDLVYTFGPGRSLVGTLRYGTEPSGFAGVSIRETLRGSLTFNYAFTPRLAANVALTYEHDNYDQPGSINDFAQEYYTGGVGLSFQLNPALSIVGRYDYTVLAAEVESGGYTRGITTLGLQIIF